MTSLPSCLSPETLAAYLASGEAAESLEPHLAACGTCQEALLALREIGESPAPALAAPALDRLKALKPSSRAGFPWAQAAALLLAVAVWRFWPSRQPTAPAAPGVPASSAAFSPVAAPVQGESWPASADADSVSRNGTDNTPESAR